MSTVGSVCLWILLLYTLYPILLTNVWKEMQFSLLLIDGLWFSRACSASAEALVFLERKLTGVPQCELHQEANWGTSFSPICA